MAVPKISGWVGKVFNLVKHKQLWRKIRTLGRPAVPRETPCVADAICQFGITDSRLVRLFLTGLLLLVLIGPAGAEPLRVGRIDIISDDIFSQSEVDSTGGAVGLLQTGMNWLHIQTRQGVLRKEFLFQPGDPYDPRTLAETERNLRALGYLNNIQVTAVDTTADGRVNIRVHTRDSWSLQTSLAYSLSSGGDSRWNVRLADRNFLGRGVTIGAGVGSDENSSYWNTWYRQRRLWGTGLQLGIDFSQREDGHRNAIFVGRPFYAEEDPWALEVKGWDYLNDVRYFLSNGGAAGLDPTASASLYALLPLSDKGVEARFQVRASRHGAGRIWRLGAGARVQELDYNLETQPVWELSDGRYTDLGWLRDPGQPMTREEGVMVYPYVWLTTLGRQWAKGRFIMQYGVVEDLPLSWMVDLMVGPNGQGVGSTTGYRGASWRAEMEVNKWLRAGPGFAWLHGAGEGTVGAAGNETWWYSLLAGWMGQSGSAQSPWLTRLFAEVGQGHDLLGDRALRLGLNRGLRTLDFDGMAGDRLVRWNVEQGRALSPEFFGLFRGGFAAFYSGGAAWWHDEDRDLGDARHEAGFGIRLGPTRSANSYTTRLDMTWALDGSTGPVFTAVTRGAF